MLLLALFLMLQISLTRAFVADLIRRLTGSNCVLIENGKVPPYYTCLGCIIEEATGCVDDMRMNYSGNVGAGCNMAIITESYNTECCPVFAYNVQNRLDLKYIGSAYPQALRCIEAVGCKDSVIYEQLLTECESVCPPDEFVDQSGSGPACLASFNGAFSATPFKLLSIVVCIAGTLFLVVT